MATLVAALGGVEFPREVDADATGIAILLELGTDIDAAVSRHLGVAGMQDVVGNNGNAEAFVLEELATQPQIDIT